FEYDALVLIPLHDQSDPFFIDPMLPIRDAFKDLRPPLIAPSNRVDLRDDICCCTAGDRGPLVRACDPPDCVSSNVDTYGHGGCTPWQGPGQHTAWAQARIQCSCDASCTSWCSPNKSSGTTETGEGTYDCSTILLYMWHRQYTDSGTSTTGAGVCSKAAGTSQ